jgi:WD40 repeat protein
MGIGNLTLVKLVFPLTPGQPTTNPTKALAYENLALDKTLTGHPNWVGSLAITPDGQTLVSGGWGQIINIWNLQTGELNTSLSGHSNDVNCLAISPDGQTLVSGSRDTNNYQDLESANG